MDFSSQQEVTGKCLHHLSTKDDPHRNDFNLPECCTGSRQMKMECNPKKSEEDALWEERMEKGAEMRSEVVEGRKRSFGWRSERREMATSEGIVCLGHSLVLNTLVVNSASYPLKPQCRVVVFLCVCVFFSSSSSSPCLFHPPVDLRLYCACLCTTRLSDQSYSVSVHRNRM